MRRVTCFFSKLVLLACCLSANAQQNGQWVDDLFFVFYNGTGSTSIFLIDENDVIRRNISTLTNITEFPVPQKFRTRTPGALWHNDRVFMLAEGLLEKNEDGTEFQRNILRSGKKTLTGSI